MKVSEAIQHLQELNQDEHILIAWWEKDYFPDCATDFWNNAIDDVDSQMDWSETVKSLDQHLEYLQEEWNKE